MSTPEKTGERMSFSRERWLDEWMQKRHGGWNPVTREDVLEILVDFQAYYESQALKVLSTAAECVGSLVAVPKKRKPAKR
jgi:hypothetical protein